MWFSFVKLQMLIPNPLVDKKKLQPNRPEPTTVKVNFKAFELVFLWDSDNSIFDAP